MVRSLVLRGVGVGALAGVLAFVFARIFADPVIQAAIAYETGREEAQAALTAEPQLNDAADLVSRAVQANLGLGFGMVTFGAAIGLLFAVAFCMAYGRTGEIRPRQLSLLVAFGGFLTLFLVPFLKYPTNPPAASDPDTILDRAEFHLLMIIGSVALAIAAVWLGKRLQARFGNWNATLLAGAAFVVGVGVLMGLLPAFVETPQPLLDGAGRMVFPGFDATLLYTFRLFSAGAQLLLWGTLGLGFAPLAERVLQAHGLPSQKDVAALA